MDAKTESGTRLVVGVDYGTTFSGLSFAQSPATDLKDIRVWTKYNGSNQHKAENNCKAPSWIALPQDNPDFDLYRAAWGYEIEPGMKTHQWIKLLLDRKTPKTRYDDPKLKNVVKEGMETLPRGWSAAALIREYLRGMYTMLWDHLEEVFGGHRLKILPMDVWVTVPAIWSEQAKLLTKKAAYEAGFSRPIDTISIIAEPEAAAHIAISQKVLETNDLIDEGSGLLVCDAGGGTVDITSYVLSSKLPRIVLDEIAIGAGGKCGGSFVDRNLHDLLTHRFGDLYTSVKEEDKGPASTFMDFFELVKRDFSNKQPSRKPTRLPLEIPGITQGSSLAKKHDKHYSAVAKRVLLSHSDWKALFDPVVARVLELVRDQVDAAARVQPIKTLVLVGGFGQSRYLREELSEFSKARNIWLTTPIDRDGAWSTVVKGAVLCGLEESRIRTRMSRKHYGVQLSYVYEEHKHKHIVMDGKNVYKYEDSVDETTRLSGFMEWAISKGEMLYEGTEFDIGFHEKFDNERDPSSASRSVVLLCCSKTEAPEMYSESRIERVGKVSYSLMDIDWDLALSKTASGKKYYRVEAVCRLRPSDKVGYMTMRILQGGVEVGKGNLRIE